MKLLRVITFTIVEYTIYLAAWTIIAGATLWVWGRDLLRKAV